MKNRVSFTVLTAESTASENLSEMRILYFSTVRPRLLQYNLHARIQMCLLVFVYLTRVQ